MDLPLPQHPRYRILRPLARGGMAMVHLALELDTGREVALKQLVVPPGASEADMRLRFQQEFLLAARLRHPNVVAHHDYAEVGAEQPPFFTMEYLPGPGLEEGIPWPVDKVLAWLPGLLAGLGYLHAHGLSHGDLKPENLRVGPDGLPRVMDLGLMGRLGRAPVGVQGTLAYMAPEVIRRAPLDRRSDLYALGAVLYHILSGQPPFEGGPREVLAGHLERAPEPLGRLVRGLPPKLEALVMRLLAKEPMARFSSAEEVARFLSATGVLRLPGPGQEEDPTLFPAPLAGRDEALGRLGEALGQARAGQVVEAWVHGPPQGDFAPLLGEFGVRAQLQGASVVRAQFRPRMAPLEILEELVGALEALAGAAGEALALRLKSRLAEATATRQAGEDPQAARLRVFQAFLSLAKAATAAGPLVLSFLEAHLAEPSWGAWLEFLRRNGQGLPLLVVAASQAEADMEALLDPERTVVELEPLPPEAISEVARSVLGSDEALGARAHELTELSGGWPGPMAQGLAALVSGGHLRRVGGAWRWPEGPLGACWAEDLAHQHGEAQLSPLAKAMREVLAARGKATNLAMWRGMAHRWLALEGRPLAEDATAFLEAVQTLEEGGWVEALPSGQHQLAPSLAQDWWRQHPLEARQRAHQAVVEELEACLQADPGDRALVIELGPQALATGDPTKGPRLALAAARVQSRLLGLEEAEGLAREALALLDPGTDGGLRLALLSLRAEVARLAGDVRLAREAHEEALPLAQPRPLELALLHLDRGELALSQSQPAEALDAAQAALQALARLREPGVEEGGPEAARAHELWARASLSQGELPQAEAQATRALGLAQAQGLAGLARDLMALKGYLLVARDEGRDLEGLTLLREAVALARQAEAQLDLTASTSWLGQALLLLGQGAEAQEAFQRNVTLCAEVGAAPHEEAVARMRLMQVALMVGDARAARKQAAAAGALARMLRDRKLLAQVRLIEGMAALQEGDVPFYEDAAGWVEAALQDEAAKPLEAYWEACRAEAEGHLGDWSAALSAASRALQLAQSGAGHAIREPAHLIKAEALLRLGLRPAALAELELVGAPRHAGHQARLTLLRARMEAQAHPEVAGQLAQSAFGQAQRAGALPWMASAAALAAQCSPEAEEGLHWARQAILAAEACRDPSRAAEAYALAARHAPTAALAQLSAEAARQAWGRAIAGLTEGRLKTYLSPPERRQLLAHLPAAGPNDAELLLGILQRPPTPEGLAQGLWALAEGMGGLQRLLLTWEDEQGQPRVGASLGPAPAQRSPAEELEAAASGQPGSLLLPLQARPPGTGELGPWGALMLTGLAEGQLSRLRSCCEALEGAFWAARQHALRRPRSPSGPLNAAPASPSASGA